MNEFPGQQCFPLSHTESESGQPTSRELLIDRGGEMFTLNITTTNYLEKIRQQNGLVTDPDAKLDDRFLVLSDITNLDKVCEEISAKPFEEIQQYLSPFNPEPELSD